MPGSETGFDARALRDACSSFATGVTVITTTTEDGDHGMTANAFMSVSLDPPLISISLDHRSKMLEKVRKSGRYAVSILADDLEPVAMHFAGRSNPDIHDPFEHRGAMPVVRGASAVFVTEVHQEIEAGDHTVFIGRVTYLERDPAREPLIFCGGRFTSLRHSVS
ncbi:MAG: flavin reductase family protein [Alphaproteobacteria bacterium]|nr:flavin reductase family protein [Alphaproteobacteria bacterium]MBU2229922.1 flavin reductase family protein [Alphaproteobacteria bacterium]